jgi:alkyl hydroperoxide reductase subunit AhpF
VKKTPIAGGGAVTVFAATYTAGGSVAGNGLYAATIGSVSNNTVAIGDLITIEVGTTDPSFTTPVYTIHAEV